MGRRIKRARVADGYRSQKAFAEAIGIHETSVARAEVGSASIGDNVYGAIENGLNWPEDCISQYLETGDESLLPSRKGQDATEPPSRQSPQYPPDLEDDTERSLWDIKGATDEDRWLLIFQWRARRDAKLRAQQESSLHQPGQPTRKEQSG